MRYLQTLNWVFLAIGATMAVNLAVVALLYGIYIEEAPRYRTELSAVLTYLLLFLFVTLAAGAAAFGQRRRSAWRWPAEVLLVVAIGSTVWRFLPG